MSVQTLFLHDVNRRATACRRLFTGLAVARWRATHWFLAGALALLLGTLALFSLPAQAANGHFGGGTGMAGNPYLIEDAADLAAINSDAAHLAASYKLKNDIDLSAWLAPGGPGHNGGAGWAPIGSDYDTRFSGNFNGAGHKITGLWINRPTTNGVGLFGVSGVTIELRQEPNSSRTSVVTSDTAIANLGVEIAFAGVRGGSATGGLVGTLNDGSITNSSVSGSVSGGDYAGGLVGAQDGGSITSSYATGSVSGGQIAGGLVGVHSGGSITSSYASSNVSGSGAIGGLVGKQSRSNITNSYATGSVSGGQIAGGLVGVQSGSSITRSYATGSVGSNHTAGGLVGEQSDGSIINSYATGSAVSNHTAGGLVGYLKRGGIANSYATGLTGGTLFSGDLVGHRADASTITASFSKGIAGWSISVGSGPTTGVTVKSDTEMLALATFTTDTHNSANAPANWDIGDFGRTWCMPADAYPRLAWQPSCSAPAHTLGWGGLIDLSSAPGVGACVSFGSPAPCSGWVYSGGPDDGVYTILDGAHVMVVNNNQQTNPSRRRLEVAAGAKAAVMLNNARITGLGGGQSALLLNPGADVTLVLADGSSNVLKGGANSAGIQTTGATLAIAGETAGTGALSALGNGIGAGIGGGLGGIQAGDGGNIIIYGGRVRAESESSNTAGLGSGGAGIGGAGGGGNGGNIAINGGSVGAYGGPNGAGIGGGSGGSGGNITINGGSIAGWGGRSSGTAPFTSGAGIGGGNGGSGGNITINGSGMSNDPNFGGGIDAVSGYNGAGIGGGYGRSGGNIIINGGAVAANGDYNGAGIGGGYNGSGGNITINGGGITATGGRGGAGIGGSNHGEGGIITIGGNVWVTAAGGSSNAPSGAGIGGGSEGAGGIITIGSSTITAAGKVGGAGIGGGSRKEAGIITISGDAQVTAVGGSSVGGDTVYVGDVGSGGGYAISSGYPIGGGSGIGSGGTDATSPVQVPAGAVSITTTGTITATGGKGYPGYTDGKNVGTGGAQGTAITIISTTPLITTSAGSGGSISPSGPVSAPLGSTQTFTVTPNPGFTAAVGGTCGGTLTGNTYTTHAITGTCTVAATFFVAQGYAITASAIPNGTGSISPAGAIAVSPGGSQAFTITPAVNRSLFYITGTCGGMYKGNTYTTRAVNNNCTVTAVFR